MNVDRLLAATALMASLASVGFVHHKAAQMDEVVDSAKNTLGTDLANYDFSSPEKSLLAQNKMMRNRDIKAGIQLLEATAQMEAKPESRYLFSVNPELKVIKSIEVRNSGRAENNGIIVSFVKAKISGVEYNFIQHFKRDDQGRFLPGGYFFSPYGDAATEEDKELDARIERFKKTGQL